MRNIFKLKKMKYVALSALLITTTFILFGCKKNKDVISINFLSHKMEQHNAFLNLIKKYKENHKNVDIKIESIGGETSYFAKLKNTFTSGKGPDLFNLSSYAEMREYEDKIKDVSDMQLIQKMNDVMKNQAGKEILIPECYESFGYIVRKDIFEKAGVDVNTMKTFNGLEKGFETLSNKIPMENFKNLTSVFGIAGSETWVFGNHMIIPILNEEFSSPEQAYNSRTFEFKAKDLYKNILDFQLKYAQKHNLVSSTFQKVIEDGIFEGKFAAVQQGTWLHTSIKEYEKNNKYDLYKKIAILPYSTPKDGDNEGKFPVYVGQYFAINKNVTDEQYKAIQEFLEYLYTTEEGIKILTEDIGFISPIKDANQKFEEDSINSTVLKAIKEGKTMKGDLSVIRTEEWGVKVLGSAVQRYINKRTKDVWDKYVIKESIDKWNEIATKQLDKK